MAVGGVRQPARRGVDGGGVCRNHDRIASAGRDGRFEQLDLKAYEAAEVDPIEYDRDIVFGDGDFIVQPRRR